MMKRFLPLAAFLSLGASALLQLHAQSPAPSAATDSPAPTPLSVATAPAALQRTELYFGRVAPVHWDEFLAQVVTPRFPDGLTWFDTHGQWQNRTGIVTKQDSVVLILICAPTPEKSRLIDEVREEYKTRYAQQSVLRVDSPVIASF